MSIKLTFRALALRQSEMGLFGNFIFDIFDIIVRTFNGNHRKN